MKTYQVDENGYYGEFGGAYVPEILHQCVENLQKYCKATVSRKNSTSYFGTMSAALLLSIRLKG